MEIFLSSAYFGPTRILRSFLSKGHQCKVMYQCVYIQFIQRHAQYTFHTYSLACAYWFGEVVSRILKTPSVQISRLPHMKTMVIFIEIFFFNKQQKKMSFSSSTNSQYFFAKISGIGPWVNKIN